MSSAVSEEEQALCCHHEQASRQTHSGVLPPRDSLFLFFSPPPPSHPFLIGPFPTFLLLLRSPNPGSSRGSATALLCNAGHTLSLSRSLFSFHKLKTAHAHTHHTPDERFVIYSVSIHSTLTF